MKELEMLRKYRVKLVREAVISSVGFGLMIGTGTECVTAFFCWLFGFTRNWPLIAVGVGVTLLAAVGAYFFKFRPRQQMIIRRVDSMDLEERVLTMTALEGDDSYIARLQREDTMQKLAEITAEQEKASFPLFAVKRSILVGLSVCLALGIAMTTFLCLSVAGLAPRSGLGLTEGGIAQEEFITVTYLTEGGGDIAGEAEQVILKGGSAATVVAVADEGWMFVGWSDGGSDPARTDSGLTANLIFTALFQEVEENSGDDGDDGDGTDQDAANDQPSDGNPQDSSDSNNQSNPSEDDPNQSDDQQDQDTSAGSNSNSANQIIDGDTDYRDVYQSYYDQAMDYLNNGGDLSPELADFIEKYFGSI